jgi:hypothetical protein
MLKLSVQNLWGQKSSHVKGWCSSGRVRSPGDFDGLNAPESRFLNHRLVFQVTDKLANKKKNSNYDNNINKKLVVKELYEN